MTPASLYQDNQAQENKALIENASIETFENTHPQRDYVISFEVPEFTSVCPKTGLPDFGTILVDYVADKTCIELKSFKYYILGFRNRGAFYENVVNTILDDIVAACQPRYCQVRGDFTPRGGIGTVVTAIHCQKGFNPEGVTTHT